MENNNQSTTEPADVDNVRQSGLQDEVVSHSLDAGRDIIQVGKTGLVLYLVLPPAGLLLGGIGGYFLFDILGYGGGWRSWLAVFLGMISGLALGFISVPFIISGLVGDVLFDAGWKTAKSGWKAARKKQRD